LVSLALLEVLTEKRYEYKTLPVELIANFDPNYLSIKTESGSFKRMISNLINNAVESLEKGKGQIHLELKETNKQVMISVKDNGIGMSAETVQKILRNVLIKTTKEKGSGIGLTQIRDTLKRNNGEMTIDSKIGEGTTINLIFPKIAPPTWVLNKLELNKNDNLIILDDDPLIHDAWDLRFKIYSGLKVKHFFNAEEAITHIESISTKDNLFLLTDYELLGQKINGLDVIKNTKLKRKALITGYYDKKHIQNQALEFGAKVLPKPLVSGVAIKYLS
jgi:hypothetical protein